MNEEKVYLKDVFNIDEYLVEGKNKLFIVSGTGSGKSTWVKDVLSEKGSVLYVTSRIAKVLEDVHQSVFTREYEWERTDNHTVMTNAKLAIEIKNIMYSCQKNIDDFLNLFDYIVIDEVHSIATDSAFAESSYDTLSFIEYAVSKNRPIITMTGTPEPIEDYFEDNGWTIIDYRRVCHYVHPKQMAMIKDKEITDKINLIDDKIVYFTNHVETMPTLCKRLLQSTSIKANEIAMITATGRLTELAENLKNDKDIGKKFAEQIVETTKVTYKDIIEKQMIPDECRILISTSTLREGIDIKNENVTMFCENHILSNLIQFLGRVRNSANKVYVIGDSRGHTVRCNEYDFQYEKDIVLHHNEILDEKFGDDDILKIEEKSKFINHIRNKHQYIHFNCILNRFEVFDLRYHEEQRLLAEIKWRQKIMDYCDAYRIPHLNFNLPSIYRSCLTDISLFKSFKWFKEHKQLLFNLIEIGYGIKDKQIEKINKKLKKKNADIWIGTGREGKTGEHANKTYWTLENRIDIADFLNPYRE